MMNFSIDNISDLELVYMGNWEYLINNQLVKEGDDPGIYRIFLTDNIKDKGDYYLDYFVNKYATYGITKEVFELIIINQIIKYLILNSFFLLSNSIIFQLFIYQSKKNLLVKFTIICSPTMVRYLRHKHILIKSLWIMGMHQCFVL